MKIKSLTKFKYSGPVHNLGVEGIHNYFAQGVLVANCYTSAIPEGRNYMDVADKVMSLWRPLTQNQRPFQVAIGGSGEPIEHPQLQRVLRAFRELDIVPNYTTNGRHWYKPGLLKATKELCGGVAISCHLHLEREWTRAVEEYIKAEIPLNLHVIIGDQRSCERFDQIYKAFADRLDYIVLLPMMQVGRGTKFQPPDTKSLMEVLRDKTWSKLAFGSGFWPWLKETPEIPAILYPPEILSKYVLLDTPSRVYNNSHEMREVCVVPHGQPMPPIPI